MAIEYRASPDISPLCRPWEELPSFPKDTECTSKKVFYQKSFHFAYRLLIFNKIEISGPAQGLISGGARCSTAIFQWKIWEHFVYFLSKNRGCTCTPGTSSSAGPVTVHGPIFAKNYLQLCKHTILWDFMHPLHFSKYNINFLQLSTKI